MLLSVSRSKSIPRAPVSSSPLPQALLGALKRATAAASVKKPAYPTSGSFDMIIKGGLSGIVPISVDWTANGKMTNGYMKIKGTVKYLVKGKVVSYALDQNNSFIKNGKIHFRSPVLKGEHVFETNVNTQKRKYDSIRKAILAIIKNKGKAPPRLGGKYSSVKLLAANLYAALLSFGVDDIKYGRSAYAVKIRAALSVVLSHKKVGWGNSASVASALHELGVNAQRDKPLKVQLRPVEKPVKGRALATGAISFLVMNEQDLRNVVDGAMLRFDDAAVAALARLRARRRVRLNPDRVWQEMNRVGQGMQFAGDQVVDALAARGVLTPEGLTENWQRVRLREAIREIWQGLATNTRPENRNRIVDAFTAALRGLGANEAAANAVVEGLQRAPFARTGGVIFHLNDLLGLADQRVWGRDLSLGASLSFLGDKRRFDEL